MASVGNLEKSNPMDAQDAAPQEPIDTDAAATVIPVITAAGLGLDGEHGPLFSDIDLELTAGFHAIRMPGGPEQHTLLLTLAGRLKPTHGTVTVLGDTQPRDIRRHCAIAAFADIDELEEMVTVQTVLAEQRRWLAPWYSRVPNEAGAAQLAQVFGEIPPPSPKAYLVELSDLNCFCCGSRWRCFRIDRSWWSAISSRSGTMSGGRSRSSGSLRSRRSAPSLSG
jgi:hypothetical protein